MSFYDDASWLLIPSGIEEDVVFAQKPTSGLGDLTFTRASDATYTDSTGVVRRSPYNLVTFSEMFTDASWVKTSSTITANTISAPNGTLTADTLTASSSFPRVVQNPTIQANQSYRISTYAKAGSASVFTIFVSVNSVTLVNNVQYNLSTGVVTGSGTMQDVGNGWYLCSATFTVGASTASPDIRFFNHAQGVTGGWSGTNFFYAWGAQLVEGTSALDYFPTTNRQDVPRIDFRNADGTLSSCGRLLLEPQRTNSFLNSLLVGGIPPTSWSRPLTGGTVTAVSSIYGNADGATAIQFVVSGAQDCIESNNISIVSGSTYTLSVYIESITGNIQANNFLRIAGTKTGTETYKINGQTITSTTNITAGLYELNFAATANSTNTVRIGAGNGLGNVTATLRISRPQAEVGAYPTTRIPTTTAAVTRIADVASKTGVSSLIGQTEGTMFAEVNISRVNTDPVFTISDGTDANRIQIAFLSSTQLLATIRVAGVNHNLTVNVPSVPSTGGSYKIGLGYKANDFCFSLNGTNYTSTATRAVPSCSVVTVGASATLASFLGDRVAEAALFPTRLTNAQLAQLTTL